MLSHYIGQYVLEARIGEDIKGIDGQRLGLLDDLRKLPQDTAVVSCISHLEKYPWITLADVDAFNRHYEQVDPNIKQLENTISRLFGRRQ